MKEIKRLTPISSMKKEDGKTKGYRCKECSFETTSRGWINAQGEIKNHFEMKHKNVINDIEERNQWLNNEIKKLEKKMPQLSLGRFIESINSVPSKKWKCTRCGEEMGYGKKYFHQQNATRNGEDYHCKLLTP